MVWTRRKWWRRVVKWTKGLSLSDRRRRSWLSRWEGLRLKLTCCWMVKDGRNVGDTRCFKGLLVNVMMAMMNLVGMMCDVSINTRWGRGKKRRPGSDGVEVRGRLFDRAAVTGEATIDDDQSPTDDGDCEKGQYQDQHINGIHVVKYIRLLVEEEGYCYNWRLCLSGVFGEKEVFESASRITPRSLASDITWHSEWLARRDGDDTNYDYTSFRLWL